MSVHIDRMNVDLDVASRPDARPAAGERGTNRRELEAQIRPLVIEILRQELDRLRREHGR